MPTHLPRFLCNAQQPETDVKVPEQPAPAQNSEGGKTDPPGFGSGSGATPSSTAVSDAAISMAAAAAAEASAAAAAAAAAALDAANAIPSPGPVTDPATNVAAAAEVIYAAGIARPPSVLDSQADAVAQTQQHSQILVGDQQEVKFVPLLLRITLPLICFVLLPLICSVFWQAGQSSGHNSPISGFDRQLQAALRERGCRAEQAWCVARCCPVHYAARSATLVAPNTALQSATDEAARLRAAMRMQGEEDVVKFRHVLLRELLAERERLQRVLDSKVGGKLVLQ